MSQSEEDHLKEHGIVIVEHPDEEITGKGRTWNGAQAKYVSLTQIPLFLPSFSRFSC